MKDEGFLCAFASFASLRECFLGTGDLTQRRKVGKGAKKSLIVSSFQTPRLSNYKNNSVDDWEIRVYK
jgi:hypothetical protein